MATPDEALKHYATEAERIYKERTAGDHTWTGLLVEFARALAPRPMTIDLDPEWTVCRRFECGHVQHACCLDHLGDECSICKSNTFKEN